jgi:hypothetical protein
MAPKSQVTASGQTSPTPDGNGPELESSAKPRFDWAALSVPVTMANKTTPSDIKVNVLETVPDPIRQRAEQSLTINVERVKAVASSTAKRPRIDYHWELQAVADKAMGDEFVKLIGKYAKYRPSDKDIPHAGPNSPKGQVTARCGDPGHYRKMEDGQYVTTDPKHADAFMGVRYSVRPFEQRGDRARLPGTA